MTNVTKNTNGRRELYKGSNRREKPFARRLKKWDRRSGPIVVDEVKGRIARSFGLKKPLLIEPQKNKNIIHRNY